MYQNSEIEQILRLTDHGYDIFRKLISPDIKLGKNVLSPLRKERFPSFSIYVHRQRGDIWYKDFPESGERYHGDALNFVKMYYSLNSTKEAIKAIKQQVLGMHEDDPLQLEALERKNYRPKYQAKQEVKFIPNKRSWRKFDLAFWHQFMIHEEILEKFNVYPVSSFKKVVGDQVKTFYEREGDPIYFIELPSGRFKIYQPLTENKAFKWKSNLRAAADVFGINLIEEKVPDLFILAGNKDVMSFTATTGLPAIALASEATNLTLEMITIFESIADRIHILYDNDATGIKMAKKLHLETGWAYHNNLLTHFDVNDYSDMVKDRRSHLPEFFGLLKTRMEQYKTLVSA